MTSHKYISLENELNSMVSQAFHYFLDNHYNSCKDTVALTGVAQWIEHQKVMGSVSQSGHRPGLQARSPVGLGAGGERQPTDVSLSHQCFSPSLSPSFLIYLKLNKIFKEKRNIKLEYLIKYKTA